MNKNLQYLIVVASIVLSGNKLRGQAADHDHSDVIRSIASGPWSAAETWQDGHVPSGGDRVLISQGHVVLYDVDSEEVIRGICISGVLKFSSDKNTELNVGLIRVESGDVYFEDGFDCRVSEGEHETSKAADKPALEIGTPEQPIAPEFTATVRLHFMEGMDPENCPAIICCGGRMDIHGAPMKRTWVKLARNADAGSTRLFLAETVEGWKAGDRVLITGSARQEFSAGTAAAHVNQRPSSEVRQIRKADVYANRSRTIFGAPQVVQIDAPLDRSHAGGEEFRVEVANLSRNVVVESADPDGVRGHTMYHHGSSGSMSYSEFRHLGKKGVLGKYPIHFHLVGDTMRGSSVIGVSVWDSHNRWLTIHGTQYLVVRDCVGYQSLGHGFFLEDGTEVYNLLDRNLAVQSLITDPLPKQALPFDLNNGSGFWWANSLNSFSRNVAVECDQYGFRFEAEETDEFDPVLPVLQPDGTKKDTDIRTLPFLCFDDNEAHCQRRFGLNLGGIRGMTHAELMNPISRGGIAHSIGGTVGGIGPDRHHPFHIRNFKVWDTHWAFHCGSPSVHVDGLNVFDCNYGIWRSVIDLHEYDNLSFRDIHTTAISFPTGGHGPSIHWEDGRPSYPSTDPVDDLPPVTVVTRIIPDENGHVQLRGMTSDNEVVSQIHINDRSIRIDREGCSEWSARLRLERRDQATIVVRADDDSGNVEPRPQTILLSASQLASQEGNSHALK